MATIWGPNIVTDGLVMALDAANVESYAPAGTIPQLSESIASAWKDYGSNQANYTVVGDDGVIIHSSYNNFIGYFQKIFTTTGYWTMAFEYQSDTGATFTIDNNGIHDNDYNDSMTATTTKQVHTKTVNITSTSAYNLDMYIYRNTGGNITISNYRFYKSDSAGNSIEWHDVSGGGNDGTLVGPGFSSSNGGFILFDGSNEMVQTSFGNGRSPTTDPLCYTVWLYPTNAPNSTYEMWAVNGDWGSNNRAYFGVHPKGTGGIFSIGVHDWGWGNESLATNGYTANNWYFIAVNFTGTNAQIYINGSLASSRSYNSYTFNRTLDIGGTQYDASYGWTGNISNVMIYDRALTTGEILQNFNAHKGRYGL